MNRILYPIGGGGAWLQHVMYGLLTHNYDIARPSDDHNFHTTIRDNVNLDLRDRFKFRICHGFDHMTEFSSFCSPKTRYNVYINAIEKYYTHSNEILKDFNTRIDFFTNIARYTFSDEYQQFYLNNIVIDHSLIYIDPSQLMNQIYHWLKDHMLLVDRNDSFIESMISQYIRSVDLHNFHDNETDHWLGWTHALMNINSIVVPFDIKRSTKSEFIGFCNKHNDFILNQTSELKIFE